MEKTFNFVYLTTNLINGKQYIGDHSTNKKLENDHYLGSGLILYSAFRQYGKQNFKREILEFFDTKEEAFKAQQKYINQYNTLSPNGYNISPTGGLRIKGCFVNFIPWNKGKHNVYSAKTLKKLSNAASLKIGEKNSFFGKHHSEETKNILREKSKINSAGEKNGMYNKSHSKKTKEKMKLSHIGLKASLKTKQKMSESRIGPNNPNAKLTAAEIQEIKQQFNFKVKPKDIAKKYNISVSTVYKYKPDIKL